MIKFLQTIIVTLLAVSFAFMLTACDSGKVNSNGNEANDGISATDEGSVNASGFDSGNDGGYADNAAEDMSIIKGEYYQLIGGDGENILFNDHEDGSDTLQFNHFEEYGGVGSIYGGLEYTISSDRLTITDDGEFIAVFTIIDAYTLKDDDGNSYTAEGSRADGNGDDTEANKEPSDGENAPSSAGIVTSGFYYHNGDLDSDSLWFFSDYTVDYDSPGADTVEGAWSVDGDTLTIIWNDTGEEIYLSIEDSGKTLVDAQGERFLLD